MSSLNKESISSTMYLLRSIRLKARWRVAPLQDWQQVDLLLDPACASWNLLPNLR